MFASCVSPAVSTEKAEKALASSPAIDLSLPKDGKIHINVNLGSKAKKDKPKGDGAAGITAGVGGLKLAPPPSAAAASSSAADKKKDKKKEAGGASGTSSHIAHPLTSSTARTSVLTARCAAICVVLCCVSTGRRTG